MVVVVVDVIVVDVVVVDVVVARQPDMFTVLSSIVTAPFLASSLPVTVAPVVAVMLVRASILPANFVVVPKVAELPTCQ